MRLRRRGFRQDAISIQLSKLLVFGIAGTDTLELGCQTFFIEPVTVDRGFSFVFFIKGRDFQKSLKELLINAGRAVCPLGLHIRKGIQERLNLF